MNSKSVLLIDVDSKMPNLALMKISAWHKAREDQVQLLKYSNLGLLAYNHYDHVYASAIFAKSKPKCEAILKLLPHAKVGGYGWNGAKLPDEIEHIMPDYDLCACPVGILFTSRGCVNNCPWCIVPKMEGKIRDHAPIEEALRPSQKACILFDNAFLDSPRWRENLQYLISHNIKVDFNQGLDIRAVTEEKASLLADCDYVNWKTLKPCLRFSFDLLEIEPQVRRGIQILKDRGIPSNHLFFYVLGDYPDPNPESVWYRVELLRELGTMPFIMKYNNRKDDLVLNHMARWNNKRFYKFTEFLDYDSGNSQKIIREYLKLHPSAFQKGSYQ